MNNNTNNQNGGKDYKSTSGQGQKKEQRKSSGSAPGKQSGSN